MTFDNSPAQVVVIEERKKRKGLALIAGGAVLALLASGGTFALWRASASFTGGQVTAGDLDLTGCENLKWYDISPDRIDPTVDLATMIPGLTNSTLLAATGTGSINEKAANTEDTVWESNYPTQYTNYIRSGSVYGHEIVDIDTWRMVPGDTVLAFCDDALVTLEGDNLVAQLKLVNEGGDDAIDDQGWEGVVYGAEVIANGEVIDTTDLADAPGYTASTVGYFGAPNYGQLDGIDEEANYVLELTGRSDDGRDVTIPGDYASWGAWNTDTASDASSLGQDLISPIFVIHFIDDGIAGDAYVPGTGSGSSAPATCTSPDTGWDEEDDATWIEDNCLDGFVEGYTDHTGDGDTTDVENNRYLAQKLLADVAGGRLVLDQVRTDGLGQYGTPTATTTR